MMNPIDLAKSFVHPLIRQQTQMKDNGCIFYKKCNCLAVIELLILKDMKLSFFASPPIPPIGATVYTQIKWCKDY
jgi:hypothetical protein